VLTCLLSAEAPRHLTAAPGKGTWPGLPETELKLIWASTTSEEPTDIKSSKKKLGVASPGGGEEESSHALPTEGVCSKKQSAVHEVVIKSRDQTFQEYMSLYNAELAVVSQRGEEERRGEERWFSNWRTAVRKVKELYT